MAQVFDSFTEQTKLLFLVFRMLLLVETDTCNLIENKFTSNMGVCVCVCVVPNKFYMHEQTREEAKKRR